MMRQSLAQMKQEDLLRMTSGTPVNESSLGPSLDVECLHSQASSPDHSAHEIFITRLIILRIKPRRWIIYTRISEPLVAEEQNPEAQSNVYRQRSSESSECSTLIYAHSQLESQRGLLLLLLAVSALRRSPWPAPVPAVVPAAPMRRDRLCAGGRECAGAGRGPREGRSWSRGPLGFGRRAP